MIFHCDFDPEDSKPIFLDNLTCDDASPYYMFGSKRLSNSDDIIWTNN